MRLEDVPKAADERATLLGFLQAYRETIVRKVDGLTDEQARRTPAETSNPPVGIVHHLGWVERWWFRGAFLGEDVGRTRDEREFRPEGLSLADAVAFYRDAWGPSDEIVRSAASLDERCRGERVRGDMSLRWVLVHMIEETARHAGHLDITRELIDGAVGE